MELAGFILDAAGKIMVSYTVIRVHFRVWKEHQIDEKVFTAMKREQLVGIIGIALIIIGSAMQLPALF
jgi:hypothetical protein